MELMFLRIPVPILAVSDLTQALTLIIASFGFYSDFFITFDRSNWRRIIRDAMDGKRRYGWKETLWMEPIRKCYNSRDPE